MFYLSTARESLEEVSCSWILFDLPSAQATISFLDEVLIFGAPASHFKRVTIYMNHMFTKVEPGPRGAYYVFIIENTHDQVPFRSFCAVVVCNKVFFPSNMRENHPDF